MVSDFVPFVKPCSSTSRVWRRISSGDGQDETAVHFIAIDEAGHALGTARLLETGQIGRMAVLANQRGRGIGRRLLDLAIEHAKTQGLGNVFLHAQTDAINFYRKAGFVTTGGTFMEAGIEHVSMTMPLPVPFEIRRKHATPENRQPGPTHGGTR